VLVLEERILNAEGFRAILSSARITIMKSLRERDKTIPELSVELGFSETAVRHHLQKLSASGFVNKKESSRKWVYFRLTPEGEKIVADEPKKIVLILSLLLVAVSSLFALFWLSGSIYPPQVVPSAGPDGNGPSSPPAGVVLSASSVFSSDDMDVFDRALDAAYSEKGSRGLE